MGADLIAIDRADAQTLATAAFKTGYQGFNDDNISDLIGEEDRSVIDLIDVHPGAVETVRDAAKNGARYINLPHAVLQLVHLRRLEPSAAPACSLSVAPASATTRSRNSATSLFSQQFSPSPRPEPTPSPVSAAPLRHLDSRCAGPYEHL
ncbi:hypothetical protein [Saccharopolyspora pogona]|uniref:hypothetical protein n=1 Tax=Saccharopolyspora pogona TaxID=333966 RepID=UPI001687C6E1|nr:hypothetical protein [Saccharopolyspora pogona]